MVGNIGPTSMTPINCMKPRIDPGLARQTLEFAAKPDHLWIVGQARGDQADHVPSAP